MKIAGVEEGISVRGLAQVGSRDLYGVNIAYSLHCSSFFGLPFRILSIELVKPITPAKTPNSNKPIKMLREFRTTHQTRNDNTLYRTETTV